MLLLAGGRDEKSLIRLSRREAESTLHYTVQFGYEGLHGEVDLTQVNEVVDSKLVMRQFQLVNQLNYRKSYVILVPYYESSAVFGAR